MHLANPDTALTLENLQHVHIRQFAHWEEHLCFYIRNLDVLQSSANTQFISLIVQMVKKKYCFRQYAFSFVFVYSQRLKLKQVIKMTSMNMKQGIVGYISKKKPKTGIHHCNHIQHSYFIIKLYTYKSGQNSQL